MPLQIKALIALVVFLTIMLILTFVSRKADELITAQVSSVSPKPMLINDVDYPDCVPLEVLHSEGDKTYVFIIMEEETILGVKTVAKRVDVAIKDENDNYAALHGGFVSSQEFVLSSNKPITSGDRVHITD